jgi:hypothetical protein
MQILNIACNFMWNSIQSNSNQFNSNTFKVIELNKKILNGI